MLNPFDRILTPVGGKNDDVLKSHMNGTHCTAVHPGQHLFALAGNAAAACHFCCRHGGRKNRVWVFAASFRIEIVVQDVFK